MVKNNPDKAFYPIMENQICSDMKKITLEKVIDVLETGSNEVFVSDELRFRANKPLTNMLELGR